MAKDAIRRYNKKHRKNYLYNFYTAPVVPLTEFIEDFPVALH